MNSEPRLPSLDWSTLLPLLEDLLPRSLEERAALISELRSQSSDLAARVLDLLARESDPDPPLLRALEAPRFHAIELRAIQSGDRLGRYHLRQVLGHGGQGVVFEAWDERLQRSVAIKFLLRSDSGNPTFAQNFSREVEAASLLSHENICPVFEGSVHEGLPMIVMRRLTGRTLRQTLTDFGSHPPAPGERNRLALQVGIAVGRGLSAAHAVGLVHRDVKPSNVMIAEDGVVSILDFGISHITQGTPDGDIGRRSGTPAYLAPEQVGGTAYAANPKSDVHALGALLFEIFAGMSPYQSPTLEGLYRAIQDKPHPELRARKLSIPHDFRPIIAACLQKEPELRPTAAFLVSELDRIRSGLAPLLQPMSPLASAIRWTKRHPAKASLAVSAIFSVALAAGLASWSMQHTKSLAWAEQRRHDAAVDESLDLAFCRALMGESTATAFQPVFQLASHQREAQVGVSLLGGHTNEGLAASPSSSPEVVHFEDALTAFVLAKRGSIAASDRAVRASYRAALAAEKPRRRNLALLAFSAELAGDRERADQACRILRTQWPTNDPVVADVIRYSSMITSHELPPESARASLRRARVATQEYRPNAALAELGPVRQDAPLNSEAIILHGRALSRLTRHGEAKTVISQGLKEHPRSAELRAEAGLAAIAAGDFPEAVVHLRLACAADQPAALAAPGLAHALAEIGRIDEALQITSQGAFPRSGQDLSEIHFHTGAVLFRSGKIAEAIVALRSCLVLTPEHVPALILLSTCLERHGDIPAALKAMGDARVIASKNAISVPDRSEDLARLERHQRDWAAAERLLLDEEISSDHAESFRLALFTHEILKRPEESLRLLLGLEARAPSLFGRPGHGLRAARVAMQADLLKKEDRHAPVAQRWMRVELGQIQASLSAPVAARRKFLAQWHQDPILREYQSHLSSHYSIHCESLDALREDLWRAEAHLDG